MLAVALIATILISGAALLDARASVKNLPGRESHLDADEIAGMLVERNREGRQFAVANEAVTSIGPGLEMVTSDVEITDRGVTWGREKMLAVVYNGKIQRLYVVHARLTPSQYW